MARVSWRGNPRQMRYRIENLEADMIETAAEIIGEVVEEGADLMQTYITARATDKVRAAGRDGRYVTWKMHDDVESTVRRNRRSVSGTFGWGVNGGDKEKYYKLQEEGFEHWISHENIKPMHALADSFMAMREEFFRRMRTEMRSRR